MKILVTGCNGLLGSSLIVCGVDRYEMIGLSREKQSLVGLPDVPYTSADITNEEVMKYIERAKPDVIIHTAAYTDVDGCERDRETAYQVNVIGTKHIRDAARTIGARLVFLSTDYVFDGERGQYRETDTPNPKSYYGMTKCDGEKLVLELGPQALVCRTQVLYGYYPGVRKNFVLWVKEKLDCGEEIRVVDDQIGSPTYASNLAAMIFDLLDHGKSGIYHTSGPDTIDRYHFALKIAEIFSLRTDLVQSIKTERLQQLAPRPLNSSFVLEKIRHEIATRPASVEEGLTAMYKEIREDRGEKALSS